MFNYIKILRENSKLNKAQKMIDKIENNSSSSNLTRTKVQFERCQQLWFQKVCWNKENSINIFVK